MVTTGRKRGRPRKIRPFFEDPIEEQKRLEKCRAEGRDPYPKFKHVPCAAERNLRKGVMPGVPFSLVLSVNNCDDHGRPYCSPAAEAKWDEARAKRQQDAQNGADDPKAKRQNYAATAVSDFADTIRRIAASGKTRSAALRAVNQKLEASGSACIGRSEFYQHLAASGIWP
jgi:hypothetical protein